LILVQGDSIYRNTGEASNAVLADRIVDQALSTFTHTYNQINVSLGGSCIGIVCNGFPSMTSRDTVDVDGWYNPNRKFNIYLLLGGINDFFAGRTLAQVKADTKTICQARKAKGWTVMLGTMEDTNVGPSESDRAAYNSYITSTAISEGWADYIVDYGGDATMGCSGCVNNATYFRADALPHPTVTGNGKMGDVLHAVLSTFGLN
jgi:hypothetical protein